MPAGGAIYWRTHDACSSYRGTLHAQAQEARPRQEAAKGGKEGGRSLLVGQVEEEVGRVHQAQGELKCKRLRMQITPI